MRCICGGFLMEVREGYDNDIIIPRYYVECDECHTRWKTIEEFEADYRKEARRRMLGGLKVQIHRTEYEIVEIDPEDERFRNCGSVMEVLDIVRDTGIRGSVVQRVSESKLLKDHCQVDERRSVVGGGALIRSYRYR